MFRVDNIGSHGFLSILFAAGAEPLAFFDKQVRSGSVKRVVDETEKGKLQCIEILGQNVASTFISSPTIGHSSLGITLPVLVLIVKNLKRFFSYQVQFLDDKNVRRRFRMTNVPGFHRRQPTISTFPLVLEEGWNELATNLVDICHRVYGTQYIETTRIEICANCRLREIFFCESFEAMKSRTQKEGQAMDSKLKYGQLSDSLSLFPFMDTNLNVIRPSSMHDEDDPNNDTVHILEEAKRVIHEYESLSKKVKKTFGTVEPGSGSSGPTQSLTPNGSISKPSTADKVLEKRKDRNPSLTASNYFASRKLSSSMDSPSKTATDTEDTPDTELTIGERLKRDMYFEKPQKSHASKNPKGKDKDK